MQKILEINSKSNKIVKNIKKEIITLINNYNLKSNNMKKMETTIKKLHNEINKLENVNSCDVSKKKINSCDEIKKKIVITKKNKSYNFRNWLFNNNEL